MATQKMPEFVPIPADVRKIIRETRTLVGISRATLEERAKVGTDYIKKLELGRRPRAEVSRLRRVLQVVQQAATRGKAPAPLQARIERAVKAIEPSGKRTATK